MKSLMNWRITALFAAMAAFFLAAPARAVPDTPAAEAHPREMITRSSSLLCASPHRVADATEAVIRGEYGRLAEFDCHFARPGLPAIRTGDPGPLRANPVWQVRLRLRDGDGVTLWGNYYAFSALDGAPLDAEGRRQGAR
jgi:hypothetical protein